MLVVLVELLELLVCSETKSSIPPCRMPVEKKPVEKKSGLGFRAAVCAAVGWHSAGHAGIGLLYSTPSHLCAPPLRLSELQKQYSAPGPSGSPSSQIMACWILESSEQAFAPAGGAHTSQAGRSSRSAARSAPLRLAPHTTPTSPTNKSATRAPPAPAIS